MPETAKPKRKIFTLKNKRHIPKWLAWLIVFLMKVYAWTFRVRIIDEAGILQGDSLKPWPCIPCIWHNRILFIAAVSPQKIVNRCAVLISASRDGEYISTIIRFFGLGVVRGSSSRGAVHALLELGRTLQEGKGTILTLDGPRGPRYTIHPGAVLLAQHNHAPILPVSLNCSSYWAVKSWDRTQIPKPFSRVTLHFGTPLYLEENLERNSAVTRILEAMERITKD